MIISFNVGDKVLAKDCRKNNNKWERVKLSNA